MSMILMKYIKFIYFKKENRLSIYFFFLGYFGPFTWDFKSLITSINLITNSKAYSDEKIIKILNCLVRSYLKQIYEYCNSSKQHHIAISSENTKKGPVNKLLKESRLGSKEAHLDTMTIVENFERKFIRSKN